MVVKAGDNVETNVTKTELDFTHSKNYLTLLARARSKNVW